jgi:hypothetical protein
VPASIVDVEQAPSMLEQLADQETKVRTLDAAAIARSQLFPV